MSEAHLQAERGLAVSLPCLIGCLISCLPSKWGLNQEGSILCLGGSSSGGPGKLGARKGCHRREEESRRVLLQLLAGEEEAVTQREWLRDSGERKGVRRSLWEGSPVGTDSARRWEESEQGHVQGVS